MKNSFRIILCAIALSLGLSSCQKENSPAGDEFGDGTTGKITVSLGFSETPRTMAAYTQSTTKPTTSWQRNIKDLLILFVDQSSGLVKDARNITPIPSTADGSSNTFTFTNIAATATGKKYDIYVIANSQQSASIIAAGGWNASNAKGKTISSLLMSLVVASDFTTDKPVYDAAHPDPEAGSTGYAQPSEIFLAKQTGVSVAPDVNNILPSFALTRAVSLFRVRIDQHANGNATVDFTSEKASFRIRRVGVSTTPDGVVAYASPKRETAVMYVKGAFKTTEPTAADGYETGAGKSILNPGENITSWKDMMIFPGGGTTNTEKFDIVLIGMAPIGYVPLGKTVDQALTAPGRVAWSGAVSVGVTANNILEVNLPLESAGKWIDDPNDPGIPEVGQYGNVEIKVNLVEWGNIISETVPL